MTQCLNCGKPQTSHLLDGSCTLGLHITIDANTLERLKTTGHPKLLRAVLTQPNRAVMQGVEIESLS